MKKFLVIFVAIMTVFAFFGCAEGDGTNLNRPAYVTPPPPPPPAASPYVITGPVEPNSLQGANGANIFSVDPTTKVLTIFWADGASNLGGSALFAYDLSAESFDPAEYTTCEIDYESKGFADMTGKQGFTAKSGTAWSQTLGYPVFSTDDGTLTFNMSDFTPGDKGFGFQLMEDKGDFKGLTWLVTEIRFIP